MSIRWTVIRHWVRHKGKIYRVGELLPESFTERDKHRNIYSRRIDQVEIPDNPPAPPAPEETTSSQVTVPNEEQEQSKVSEGVVIAKPIASPIKTPPGTIAPIKKVIKK